MAQQKNKNLSVDFRPAKPSDAKIASRLLFETFPKKATFIVGLGSRERAISILEKIFPLKGHRLSYEFTEMVLLDGKVAGLVTSFPGSQKKRLDRQLDNQILRQYNLRGKIAVISRGFPLVFIKEASQDEYFLNNLVVKKGSRRKGLGNQVLSYVENKAKSANLNKVSLIVHVENKSAREFYKQNGYEFKALHLESNKRVRYLGAGYQRMVKVVRK